MSTDTEHVEDLEEASILDTWQEWYHIPVMGVIVAFMFWVRAQAYERFITDDGTPALQAVDSWYHWRTVEWTAENYPRTMPFEVWTSFPSGRYVGQFGTLFDQLIVTAAMIVGLGSPSTETLYLVSLLAVPAMAALVAVPAFYIGRRLGGTIGGFGALLLLALAPGEFLRRSTAGQLQHHAAEVLFMAIAILAMMVALRVAETEQPIYELIVDRDWEGLRTPAIYSALAGIALSLYIWVWPPGVVLIGIFAIFFTIHLCIEYARGTSPDHIAFVGAISLGVTALITTILIEEPGTSATSFGYLQPLAAVLVGAGCVFMAWLARQWNNRELPRTYYPAAVFGLIAVSLGFMAVVLPDLFSSLIDNFTRRALPIGPSDTDLTIQEAQPPDDMTGRAFAEFGTAFYTMLAGLVLLAIRPWRGREFRAEHTLILVWALFILSMAMTQVRFFYYLVLAVAVVNAVFIGEVARLLNFDIDMQEGIQSLRQIETYQIITLILVVSLLFMPLLPPVAGDATDPEDTSPISTAWTSGDATAPFGEAMKWEDSTHWLNDNSPEPGNYAGAGNEDELEYFGTYEYPEGGDHDYPEGAYGVISWWDYGHLITVQGERIPHSNPFQSNADSSSAFLTAESEERAELILDSISVGESPSDESNEELEAMVGDGESHEEMRYVMIDDATAGGKFNAITEWTGPDFDHYFDFDMIEVQGQEEQLPTANQQYQDTMTASLYLNDADGLEHYRLVHESDSHSVVGGALTPDPATGQFTQSPFDSTEVGSGSWNDFAALDMQLQAANDANQALPAGDGFVWDGQIVSSVKTFERVDGATLTGSVDPAAVEDGTVTAAVGLETSTDRQFVYTQEADVEDDGSFEVTVPYATDDELGPEDGYTDSSLEALDDYRIVVEDDGEDVFAGETEVPESAVVEGETIDVTLEDADAVDFDAEPDVEDEAMNLDEEAIEEAEDTEQEEEATPVDGDGGGDVTPRLMN